MCRPPPWVWAGCGLSLLNLGDSVGGPSQTVPAHEPFRQGLAPEFFFPLSFEQSRSWAFALGRDHVGGRLDPRLGGFNHPGLQARLGSEVRSGPGIFLFMFGFAQ